MPGPVRVKCQAGLKLSTLHLKVFPSRRIYYKFSPSSRPFPTFCGSFRLYEARQTYMLVIREAEERQQGSESVTGREGRGKVAEVILNAVSIYATATLWSHGQRSIADQPTVTDRAWLAVCCEGRMVSKGVAGISRGRKHPCGTEFFDFDAVTLSKRSNVVLVTRFFGLPRAVSRAITFILRKAPDGSSFYAASPRHRRGCVEQVQTSSHQSNSHFGTFTSTLQ